jgi:hypothetical protein
MAKKKQSILEWTILSADEGDWEGYLNRTANPRPALSGARWDQWQWWGLTALLLVGLCSTALILWHKATAGVAQIEGELYEAVKLETWMDFKAGDISRSMLDDETPKKWQHILQKEQLYLSSTLDERTTIMVSDLIFGKEFGKEIVAVQVVLNSVKGGTTYRQTRFYRSTNDGWLRTAPDITLWGPSRQLETEYFVIAFHQQDAQAVAALSTQVDNLYTTLRSNFGLPLAASEPKLRVEVNVMQPPGTFLPMVTLADPFILPSPALYLASDGMTDAELLMQALALHLIEYLSFQAQWRYTIPREWPPILGGLRLWQLWELELPLSAWQDEVVEWVYGDIHVNAYGEPGTPPEHYSDLCAAYALWMESPQRIRIPIECEDRDGLQLGLTRWNPFMVSLHTLAWGLPAADADEMSKVYGKEHPSKAVALATLFEYTVATYGREQLPALIAGFGTYEGWGTLLPAVLGVSAADFEAGWRSYLVQQYNVTLGD